MATEMTVATGDGVAPSTPQPPLHAQDDISVHAERVQASANAVVSPQNAVSLVELHALPLEATIEPPRAKRKYKRKKPEDAAVEPPRAKRKYTKRKKPTDTTVEPPRVKRKYTKRKKPEDAAVEPPRVKRKYTKRKKPEGATGDAPGVKRKHRKKLPDGTYAPVVKKKRVKPDEPPVPTKVTQRMRRELGMTRAEVEAAPPELVEAIIDRHIRTVEREQRFQSWLADKPNLPLHMEREHPPLPEVVVPDDPEIVEKVEKKIHFEHARRCTCESCKWKRRDRKIEYQYACRVFGCKQRFDDVVEFLEHQIDEHSTITAYCKRVCEEVARHQIDILHPPLTVYLGMQYLNPGYRPTPWTMKRVEEEYETLDARIAKSARLMRSQTGQSTNSIAPAFRYAYKRVKQFGPSELHEQYKIALEHYESSLVFPTGPRNRQDVFSTIGIGRNWLISPEPENAERSQLLKLLGAKVEQEKRNKAKHATTDCSDDDETDDEVVLFEFGEMPLEKSQSSETETVDTAQPSGKETVDPAQPHDMEVVVASPSKEEMLGYESEPDVILI